MPKAMFGKPVKYKGNRYPAYTEFEVLKKDVKEVTAEGGWILEEPEESKASKDSKNTNQKEEQEVKSDEYSENKDGA